MRKSVRWMLVMTLTFGLLAAVGCKKDDKAGDKGDKTAQKKAEKKAEKPDGNKATADKAAADKAPAKPVAKPVPKKVELVTPKPVPLPADMPKYDGIAQIPADAYEVHTKMGDKPATILLKKDTVVHGVPCMAKKKTGFFNGENFASCTLAVDFELEGIALQKGTEIKFQTNDRFAGFKLPHPQLVLGQPVSANELVYLSADKTALSDYTLAKDHKFGELAFTAGTKVSFAPNAQGHPLQAVKLGGETTVAGTTYAKGVRIYFNADGSVRMVKGVPKTPAEPLTCPAETTVTVTTTNRSWPEGFTFGAVKSAGVQKQAKKKPLNANKTAWVYLANYDVTKEKFNIFREKPAEGQAMITLQIQRDSGAKIAVGTYEICPTGDVDFYTSASIKLPGGRTLRLDSWKTTGSVEVTVVDGDKLCGRFDLKDPFTQIKGTFSAVAPAAPVKK